jgi:hypothetical protein
MQRLAGPDVKQNTCCLYVYSHAVLQITIGFLLKERILRNNQIYPTHHSVTRWAWSTTIAFKLSAYFFDFNEYSETFMFSNKDAERLTHRGIFKYLAFKCYLNHS